MRFRVLSFNVWGLPSPVGRHVEERLALLLRDLPALDCDVALFQEVWTDESRQQLKSGGQRLGYPHAFHSPGPARGAGGLLAISRLPILETGFRRFTLCGLPQRFTQMDYYGGKGVARIEVDVGGTPVAVFNTHLHARYAPATVADDYRGHRTAEVIEMAEEFGRETGPLIAVGDFNMQDSAPEYRVLTGLTQLVDAAAALGVELPTSTLDNAFRSARGAVNESRIDYVFCRDGERIGARPASCRRVLDDEIEVDGEPGAYSDHAGVLAEIEVGGPGSRLRPVEDDVFALAQQLLDAGRKRAARRRTFERASAGASIAVGAGVLYATRGAQLSRRRFLGGSFATAAVASAGGLLTLSEHFVPEEFSGFDDAETALARLRAAR